MPEDETYVGPCGLTEALNAAEPSSRGTRIAVSSPDGDWVAIRHEHGRIELRKGNRISGRAGSVMDTGKWADDLTNLAWRPF